MKKLNDIALLTQLKISQAIFKKIDKKATQQVAEHNSAILSAGRYNKSLLPTSTALDDVKKMTTYIRTAYYENTLPWGIDGTAMLPSKHYLTFMKMFRDMKVEWQGLVNKFIQEYPKLQLDSQRLLGNLYNPHDYPHVDEVASKFNIDLIVLPVPSDDFRVGIDESELKNIQADVQQRVEQSSKLAMKELYKRLYEPVKHMAERLADPNAIFRDTLTDNISKICDVLDNLNIDDDKDLENLRQEVETKLSNTQPEALRNDPNYREDTCKNAKDIMNKMSVFMEGLDDS